MRFKVIILDFDGTLVESNGIKDEAFKELFKSYPDYLDRIMRYHFAHNAVIRYEKFKYITENILGRSYTKEVEQELNSRFSSYVAESIKRCPYVKGAEEFLDYFYGKIPLYMASVNPADELRQTLEARGLKKYFKKIYAHPWVKTKAIEDIIAAEGVCRDEVLFVGDRPEDYKAAKEAGVFFVGRGSNRSFKGADIPIYKDFTGIKNYACRGTRQRKANYAEAGN